MITLNTSLVSDNVGLPDEDIVVKSVSAAWNKIRMIRDTTDSDILQGTVLQIKKDDPLAKIPSAIQFILNKKGKIEFKTICK